MHKKRALSSDCFKKYALFNLHELTAKMLPIYLRFNFYIEITKRKVIDKLKIEQ